MEDAHPLKALLQLQLASDSYAVLHLPYVLQSLTPECFLPSPHIQRWTARVNSLLYSKDAGARWSGLCIASQTAVCSRDLMMECAQSWIGVALPLLSKNEPLPVLKATIRLLRRIFSSAMDVPEYQRQLCTPNVPKFSLALIAIAEKQTDMELKLQAITTLTYLVPLYPTLHRALHASLLALAMRSLNGSAPRPTSTSILAAVSQLYSVLHVTGGKVGATNLWRKSLDETLAFAWTAFLRLRTTYPQAAAGAPVPLPGLSNEDPILAVPLNLDRLRAAVHIIRDLLKASVSRPVLLPIGSITRLCLALMQCTPKEKADGHVDLTVRSLELAVIPAIWALACTLLEGLAECSRAYLRPCSSQLLSYISYHLEHSLTPSQRLPFLRAITALLSDCSHIDDSILSSRMGRAILPSLTVILSTQTQVENDADQSLGKERRRKGKKRARGYEGDEIFKVTREIICATAEEGGVLLAAVDALSLVMRNTTLAPAVYSIASRVLLSIQLALPQLSPSLLSPDVGLHRDLSDKVRYICTEFASGTSSAMSKSLGLVITTMELGLNGTCGSKIQQELDLLLHPRMPPLIRSLPHVEALSLFHAEESEEEHDARKTLGLGTLDDLASAQTLENPAQALSAPPVIPRGEVLLSGSRAVHPFNSIPAARDAAPPPPVPPVLTPNDTISPSRNSFAEPEPFLAQPPRDHALQPQNVTLAPPQMLSKMPPHISGAGSTSTRASALGSLTAAMPSDIPPPPTLGLMYRDGEEEDEDEPMPTIDMDSDSD